MMEKKSCVICGTHIDSDRYIEELNMIFYICPICGRFATDVFKQHFSQFDLNHLSSFMVHNGFIENGKEYRYFTTMDKEKCDEYKEEFNKGNIKHGHPVHLSKENVENWYPKTFSEKIDFILLYLDDHIKHMGENIKLSKDLMFSVFFVDRYDISFSGENEKRPDNKMDQQLKYVINYLIDNKLIICETDQDGKYYTITLLPAGYARVDTLQKNTAHGKDVLVAMKFGEKTDELREAIRKGIEEAGYNPILIDEVQHNNFITPELLKYIKDSKFVVVDLTHKNNGAYFEEGYAMGLGKPVIQLCKKRVRLHFDIAQKNTIIWDKESDIPDKLKNRIIATID